MREVFDNKEYDLAQPHQDAELTLGPVMLLGIFFVLALICAGFFGWGYSVGHRASNDASAVMKPAPDAPVSAQAGCVQSKPPASSQADLAPAPEVDGADQTVSLAPFEASEPERPASPQSGQPAGAGASTGQPQVRPVLALAANASQPSEGPGGGLKVQPALVSSGGLMVQIAAVSHQEDADVLVGALRKRGYAVTARREADTLIHVRIGPFTSRDEANRWCQRLLGDGYNAIVQP